MDFSDKRKYITATVDRLEGEKAVLKMDDGGTINWPSSNLPADVSEGSVIKLVMQSDKTEEEEREATAKALLNELLKTE
jgi:hypothetical protein